MADSVSAQVFGAFVISVWLGPKIWDILLNEIKNSKALHEFKAKYVKSYILADCPCRLCKRYVAQVGFIWGTRILKRRNQN